MTKFKTILLGAISIIFFVGCSSNEFQVREKQRFTENWKFKLGEVENGENPELADSSWRLLDLPHDWSIEGEFSKDHPAGTGGGALPGGIGWYRKSFTVSGNDSSKQFYIDFDGIYRNSDVWINGHHLGNRPNGYISFRYNLTPYIDYDSENILAVRVKNSPQPNSRWYSGSGIYRNVYLVKTNKLHVGLWGTYITTPEVSDSAATVDIETQLVNNFADSKPFNLRTTIYNENGNEITHLTSEGQTISDSANVKQRLKIQNPALWSVESPTLYTAVTQVLSEGEKLDIYSTKFGVRKFHFERNNGFFLNGAHTKILGVCEHHDLGALGAAVNKSAIKRRLKILKDMGANAIRTAHNPPSPELLDLTDAMGFIVMDEAFDVWKRKKVEYGYFEDWDEWHRQDMEDLVRRDRNHPSVMIWSIGNEVWEQGDSTGAVISRDLADAIHKWDTTRPITAGMNSPNTGNYLINSGALDLVGFNYHNEEFAEFLDKFPDQKFIATETTSALGTRGDYDMPSDSIRRWPIAWDEPFTEGNDDFTVSSYDNVSTPWESTHEEAWRSIKGKNHLSGMFIWTGFDYLDEPTPYGWPARNSYFGIIDLAGFPKNAYYMYQSEWTDKDVLHLLPHWNWETGDTVDVWTYTSADTVELFLNGESKGVKTKPDTSFHMQWRLQYEPGTLRAVAISEGDSVMEKEVHTAGEPAKIRISADKTDITADGRDLSFIKAEILDKNGNFVPIADNELHFEVSGVGELAALSSGNPVSHESYQAKHRKAFNGLCRAIIRPTVEAGSIKVNVSSEGLQSTSITLQSK